MTQLIPFDTSKGGNVPNLCLDNVRRGYGIGNKYGSAWEAWENTEQHPDRNIPAGLAVPIYYSYTTTINGVTQNYGHINVQLPNGTVWSDGNIYASIDDYMSKKFPKFVGWGESVNGFKVIQEGDEVIKPTEQQVRDTFQKNVKRPPTQDEINIYTQNDASLMYANLLDAQTAKVAELEAAPAPGFVSYSGTPLYIKV